MLCGCDDDEIPRGIVRAVVDTCGGNHAALGRGSRTRTGGGGLARYRLGAVGAVLVALATLAWSDTGAVEAAATGLVATTYLLNTATVSAPHGVVPTTVPSVAGAVTFACAAVLAALVPAHLAWVPLAAPILVILLYAGIVRGLALTSTESQAASER